jgi:hypothetical protein
VKNLPFLTLLNRLLPRVENRDNVEPSGHFVFGLALQGYLTNDLSVFALLGVFQVIVDDDVFW